MGWEAKYYQDDKRNNNLDDKEIIIWITKEIIIWRTKEIIICMTKSFASFMSGSNNRNQPAVCLLHSLWLRSTFFYLLITFYLLIRWQHLNQSKDFWRLSFLYLKPVNLRHKLPCDKTGYISISMIHLRLPSWKFHITSHLIMPRLMNIECDKGLIINHRQIKLTIILLHWFTCPHNSTRLSPLINFIESTT